MLKPSWWWSGWLVVGLMMPALAQGEFVEYTTAQRELNEKAAQASQEGRHEDAVRMLRASLDIGQLNFTYLNLGIVYAKWGKCNESQDAFDKALTAPKAESPSPDQVAELLGKAKLKLAEICDGTLVVRCTPQDLQLSFDGEEAVSCLEQPFSIAPGEHTVVATHERGKSESSSSFTMRGLKTETIELAVEVKPKEKEKIIAPVEPPPPHSYTMTIVGSVVAVVGIGGLVTAGILELQGVDAVDRLSTNEQALSQDPDNPDLLKEKADLEDEISDLRIFATMTWIAGGLLTATGITLVVLDLLEASDTPEPGDPEMGFWLAPGGGGISLQMRW